jgi:hypothetical protein
MLRLDGAGTLYGIIIAQVGRGTDDEQCGTFVSQASNGPSTHPQPTPRHHSHRTSEPMCVLATDARAGPQQLAWHDRLSDTPARRTHHFTVISTAVFSGLNCKHDQLEHGTCTLLPKARVSGLCMLGTHYRKQQEAIMVRATTLKVHLSR